MKSSIFFFFLPKIVAKLYKKKDIMYFLLGYFCLIVYFCIFNVVINLVVLLLFLSGY